MSVFPISLSLKCVFLYIDGMLDLHLKISARLPLIFSSVAYSIADIVSSVVGFRLFISFYAISVTLFLILLFLEMCLLLDDE